MGQDKSNTRVNDLLAVLENAEDGQTAPSVVPVFNGNKINLKNLAFNFYKGGQETGRTTEKLIEVIVVKASAIQRSYYEKDFDENKPAKPFCWSDDTRTGRPSPNVSRQNVQSQTCFDCVWNVKGSGKGDSRGCRFHSRIGVMVADEGIVSDNTLYQIHLPATSVFGDNSQKMGLQAYVKHLTHHKTPLSAVITEIYFDRSSDIPKLLFKPKRAITENEFKLAVDVQKNPESDAILAFALDVQSPFAATEGFTF